jgi:hypothetical protein
MRFSPVLAFLSALMLGLCITRTSWAMPGQIMQDLEDSSIVRMDQSVASMPREVREALRRLFKQSSLSIANPGKPYRDTDVITNSGVGKLPTRRLVLAFSTKHFYYVYYRAGGYENAGKLVAFVRRRRAYEFVWGGVELVADDPATVKEVAERARRQSFDDSKKFFW